MQRQNDELDLNPMVKRVSDAYFQPRDNLNAMQANWTASEVHSLLKREAVENDAREYILDEDPWEPLPEGEAFLNKKKADAPNLWKDVYIGNTT